MAMEQPAGSTEIQYPVEVTNAQSRKPYKLSLLKSSPESLYCYYAHIEDRKIKNNLIFHTEHPTAWYTAVYTNKKSPSAEVVLLMDSNGKHLDTHKMFLVRRVSSVCCANTGQALQLLKRDTLGTPACIVIHTGTNDLRALQQHTARAVRKVAVRATQEFPDSRVVISTLLPRADTPPHIIASINAEITRGCATLPSVHLVHHPALGPWHLHDAMHLNRPGVIIFAKSLKDIALGRSPTSTPHLPTSRAQ
ncbi:hypothetical protein SKAU_G00284160 [Synaphobranchus kaupii]|uniref:SGNH hydrolase-type esterase domain-containing protein n=1 Tax=Synaphobranchus kaupii TaxID=118154 RepID=A0A9Q1EXQ8_SYNKA|nr:hypothetical protein SKAU_G00284160 [Synaphobranchus kaupii]